MLLTEQRSRHRFKKRLLLLLIPVMAIAALAVIVVAPDGILARIEYWIPQFSSDKTLPAPYATHSVYRWPAIVAQPEGAALTAPPGFSVEVYAERFAFPRYMTLAPGGEVLISDGVPKPHGSVYILEPGKEPGALERRKLITKLDMPFGTAFWKDYLYVAEIESVKRYRYDPKTRTVGPPEAIVSLKGLRAMHWTRTVLFDPAGEKLYLSVGSGSNAALGEDPRRAAINRYNPDGSGHETFASGLRNAVGLRWYPGTHTLWATVNERDDLGDDLVPDYFTHVQEGGFYGWPYAYIGPHPDPQNSFLRRMRRPKLWWETLFSVPGLIKSTLTPDVLLGAHVAPLGMIFYTGNQFPAEYRGGAFLAFHGSSNRSQRVGYNIGFIPFRDGQPSGPLRPFLTGWLLKPSEDVWGRPVGLLQLPDGSLLVSDDGSRKIWRVRYNGPRPNEN